MNILIVAATHFEITSKDIAKNTVLITGLGMVNTAISLTRELMKSNYDLVINAGIAGSFVDNFVFGDVVEVIEDNFSEIGFQDNLEFSLFNDFDVKTKHLVIPKTYLRRARAITVNTVHGNQDSINSIIKRVSPDIESMEGASVFKVCEEFKIECMQIRAISNRVEPRDKDKWELDLAVKNLNFEVEKIISDLCN